MDGINTESRKASKDNRLTENSITDSRTAENNKITANNRVTSSYLIAQVPSEDIQKEILFRILGPVFFGQEQASDSDELAELFRDRYGINVDGDFIEGDEHYDEYIEAQQALAEGMHIYSGSIPFESCVLAELADVIWAGMEQTEKDGFRRINTLLEE